MTTFQNRLYELIEEKGITQQQLAGEIDTTKSTISRYLTGKIEPKKHFIEKLADYFDVSVDYLLGRSNEKQSANEIKKAISDNPELIKAWEEISRREDLQILFKQTKDMDESSIRQVIRIIKAIEEEEQS